MNSLSWMIYAADVVGGIGNLAVGVVVASLAAQGAFVGVYFANGDGNYIYSTQDRDRTLASRAQARTTATKWLKRIPVIFGATLVIAAVIPSSSTVYAIAASEMGESALHSDTGSKAVKALNAWLDRQISDDSAKDEAK